MAENFTILIVEDATHVADTIKEGLTDKFSNVSVEIEHDLNNAVIALNRFAPDAVILDLIQGPLQGGSMAGNLGWQELWNHRFVPLIVYTASPLDTDPPLPPEHPFVVRIAKGNPNSLNEVLEKVGDYLPYMEAVKKLTESVTQIIHGALTKAAPLLWKTGDEETARNDIFSRVLTRRIAASIDASNASTDRKLCHWEQFIYPPLEKNLLMGDFLHDTSQPWDDPESYRVILTPSCDLVRHNGTAKAEKVMVARCVGLPAFWDACQINTPTNESDEKKALSKLTSLLNDSLPRGGLLPSPDLPTILPIMAINLRALELMKYADVEGFDGGNGGQPGFKRIVSVDSPFRESLAWAYMHVAGRPGLPDREVTTWAQAMIAAYKQTITRNN